MPRIALISTSYPDSTPGSEAAGSFVEDFAIELSSRFEVTVLAAGGETIQVERNGVDVRRFAVPRLPLSLLRPSNPLHWRDVFVTLVAGRNALERLVEDHQPDHILALWALPSGWWARSCGVPFSVWALGSDIWSLGRVPVVRKVLADVLREAKHRFADGHGLCAAVEELSSESCDFLPSTRSLPLVEKSRLAEDPPYKFAFLGRWHPNKGADLLLQALAELDDEAWASIEEFRFFGGGPMEAQVRKASQELSERGRPITVGSYLDKQDATELIAWADYLVLPSRIESIPVIFSDAMKVGTPMVATPVGDLPRLYDDYRFGVLADSPSSNALADAIRVACDSSPTKYATGIARAARDFDLTKIVDQFLHESGIDENG